MRHKKIVLVVDGASTLAQYAADLIVQSPTADIYSGPPPIEITGKPEESLFPTRPLIQTKKRDWEQRNRKRRR